MSDGLVKHSCKNVIIHERWGKTKSVNGLIKEMSFGKVG